jgi:hypothetical protein
MTASVNTEHEALRRGERERVAEAARLLTQSAVLRRHCVG